MPRALHRQTKVQRGPSDAQGRFETRDASPRMTLLGLAIAGALLVAGLLFAALVVAKWGGPPQRTSSLARAPKPQLLVDPARERQKVETAATRTVDEGRLANAMQAIVEQDRLRASNSGSDAR